MYIISCTWFKKYTLLRKKLYFDCSHIEYERTLIYSAGLLVWAGCLVSVAWHSLSPVQHWGDSTEDPCTQQLCRKTNREGRTQLEKDRAGHGDQDHNLTVRVHDRCLSPGILFVVLAIHKTATCIFNVEIFSCGLTIYTLATVALMPPHFLLFFAQSPGPDPVQPRADHHSQGHHRSMFKSWRGGDEEGRGILRQRHGRYERKTLST